MQRPLTSTPARPDADARRALESRIACEITFPRLHRLPLRPRRRAARRRRSPTTPACRSRRPTSRPRPRVARSSATSSPHARRPQGAPRPRGRLPARQAASARSTSATTTADDKPWLFPQTLGHRQALAGRVRDLQGRLPSRNCCSCRVRPRRRRPHLPGHRRLDDGAQTLLPILQPYDTLGSTRYVDFDTTRPVL